MRFLVLAMGLTFAMPAHAETGADCARLPDPDARLSCFDALFVIADPVQNAGQWQVQDTRSALDDSRRVVLTVQSIEQMRGRFGSRENAILVIRCEENTTSLFIRWGGISCPI